MEIVLILGFCLIVRGNGIQDGFAHWNLVLLESFMMGKLFRMFVNKEI